MVLSHKLLQPVWDWGVTAKMSTSHSKICCQWLDQTALYLMVMMRSLKAHTSIKRNPCILIDSGWDICSRNIADACTAAKVLDISIQDQLRPYLSKMKPRQSIYCPDFIAANQKDRADNVLSGKLTGYNISMKLLLLITWKLHRVVKNSRP